MTATLKKYDQLKTLFDKVNPEFAWQVMTLQIQVEQSQNQEIEDLMKLIQLYMIGVEVLQSSEDKRYAYFNHKIHSLMLKKSVIEKLHHFNYGAQNKEKTLQMVQKKELEVKKSEYELQIYLQKEAYNMSSIKDFLTKQQQNKVKRQSNIKNNVKMQQLTLQKRITDRKLRSSSKNKPQSIQKQPEIKIVVKQSAQYSTSAKNKEKPAESKGQSDD